MWSWLSWLPQGLQAALGIADKVQADLEKRAARKAAERARADTAAADDQTADDRREIG